MTAATCAAAAAAAVAFASAPSRTTSRRRSFVSYENPTRGWEVMLRGSVGMETRIAGEGS